MSTGDSVEPMDQSEAPTTSPEVDISCLSIGPVFASQHVNSEQDKNDLQATLCIQWPEDDDLEKRKFVLPKALQTWASTLKKEPTDEVTCEVLATTNNATEVVVSIKPPQDVSVLVALKGRTLQSKDGRSLTVTSVSWGGAEDVVTNAPFQPPPEPKYEREQVDEENSVGPPTAGGEYLYLQADIFQALCSAKWKEIRLIEERNNCVLEAQVKVAFAKGKGEGNPYRALYDFKALIQSLQDQHHRPGIAPKRPYPEEAKDTLTRTDKPEEDQRLVQSSLEQNGPSQNREFSSGASGSADVPLYQQKPGEVKMNISDPLFSGGITMDESTWKLMTTSYYDHLVEIQKKFGVQFDLSIVDQDKVRFQVVKRRNAALESHAVRALLHLCRRITTSLFNINQPRGAMGFTGSQKYPADPPENMPKLKGQSGDSVVKNKCTTGDDNNVKHCPICFDKITDGSQLDCGHDFCHECLLKSVNSMGPCCPVCKRVFGIMVGNQPDGTMTTTIIKTPLPGFPKCNTIVITYNIPSGIQTEKHQNPGKPYNGTSRKAYLPNNKEGNEVLQLLKKAFNQKLIFTIGESRTTSASNQVTWNDIHHKTSMDGGPSSFGYPDRDYLKRVRAELKDKGIE